jgi:hypothetical protein
MILYLKPLKNSTKKLLNTINSFIKVAVHKKINLQNSAAFLYTNNEQTEKEHRIFKPTEITIRRGLR